MIASCEEPIRWRSTLVAQLVLLYRSGRLLFLLLMFAALGLVIFFNPVHITISSRPERLLQPTWSFAVAAIGAAWGCVIWRDEGPSKRAYHRSLPVDATKHDFTRIVAGFLWLVVALSAFLITCVFVAVLSNWLDVWSLLRWLPSVWLGFLIASVIGYAFLAGFTTLTDRALEWAIILFVFVQAIRLFGAGTGTFLLLGDVIGAIVDGRYGIATTISGFSLMALEHFRGADATFARRLPTYTLGCTLWLGAGVMFIALSTILQRRKDLR